MARRYHILDVFTGTKLAGNPLAVVHEAADLDEAAMQAIAREFNLSETVFVLDPKDPVNLARLRIFTPVTELPFAGHPTIGAAVILATLRAPELLARQEVGLVLEEAAGLVACTVRQRTGEAAHARFDAPLLAVEDGDAPDDIARTLGLGAPSIGFADHRRARRFTAGTPMTFVPLATLDDLGQARLTRVGEDPASRSMYYLYTPNGAAEGARSFRTRMLASGLGVSEDPATGSAAAAFAGVLLANERLEDGEHDCILHQGVEMGRPSRIGLAFGVRGGRLVSTIIAGHAVLVAEGRLHV